MLDKRIDIAVLLVVVLTHQFYQHAVVLGNELKLHLVVGDTNLVEV